MNTTMKWGVAGLAAFALTACDKKPAEDAPTAEPTEAETLGEDPSGQSSIMRDDVEIDRELPLLKPLKQRISFDEGGDELSSAALGELQNILDSRQMKTGGLITIGGHTDSAGYDEANLRASQRRADAVRDWLVEKGVAESRITVIAFGEQNPARPNAKPDGSPNEKGQAFNRRVVVDIALPPEAAAQQPEEAEPTLIEKVTAED